MQLVGWAMLFGLGWLAIVGLNALAWSSDRRRYVDAVGLAFLMLVNWSICQSSLAYFGVPDGMRLWPLWDGLCAVVVAVAWTTDRRKWKAVLLGSFVAMMALHLAFWLHYLGSATSASTYLKLLDVAALVQMAIAGWPGANHVAGRLCDLLFPSGPRVRHLGH